VGRTKHTLHGAHWCHLANMIEPEMRTLCQTALTTCYHYYYNTTITDEEKWQSVLSRYD